MDFPLSTIPLLGYPLVNKQFAIENDPIEIVNCPMKNAGSFHSFVKLPEGTPMTLGK